MLKLKGLVVPEANFSFDDSPVHKRLAMGCSTFNVQPLTRTLRIGTPESIP